MTHFQDGPNDLAPNWVTARLLNAFVLTAQTGSISAAARQLGITPSAVSKAIQALEHQTNHTLFWRNTRRLSLSAAGERLLPYCKQALDQLATAGRELIAETHTITGKIKIAASAGLARYLIGGPLADWLQAHPGLVLDWTISTRFLLPGEDCVDVLLRVAESPPDEWVAIPLWETRLVTVASPAYLERYGVPATPVDLGKHRCLVICGGEGARVPWQFKGSGAMNMRATMVANDESTLLAAAEASLGIAQALDFNARASLEAGRLCEVLTEHQVSGLTVFALRPAGVGHGKLRAFVDAVTKASAAMSVSVDRAS